MFAHKGRSENILQDVWKHFESENFSDVVLIAGLDGTKISAHRLILSAASDYFRGMFTSTMRECNESQVIIPEMDGEMLRSLVTFCYKGHIDIREDNVEKILVAANLLLLDDVVTACATFLAAQLDPSNCLGIALLADQYDCHALLQQAKAYTFNNFVKVYKYDEFLMLNVEQLGQILSSDDINVKTEKDVFESLILWIQHDPTGREKHKDELLSFVRMPLLPPDFIVNKIKSVFTSAKCQALIKEALKPNRGNAYINTRASLRNSDQLLIAITNSATQEPICYFCPKRKMWVEVCKTVEIPLGCGCALINDELFIVGGNGSNAVQCLNLATMTYRRVNPMLQCHHRCAAAVVCGNLYVLGDNTKYSTTIGERLCPISNTWSYIAPMTKRRYDFGIAVLNDKLYAIGGNDSEKYLRSVECYDPVKDTWTTIASMKEIRSSFQVTVAQGHLYVIGGSSPYSTIERYDPVSNKWSLIKSNLPPEPFFCTTYYDKIVAVLRFKAMRYDSKRNNWRNCIDLDGLSNVQFLFSHSVTLPQVWTTLSEIFWKPSFN